MDVRTPRVKILTTYSAGPGGSIVLISYVMYYLIYTYELDKISL